jgi:hypothetical protein
MTGSRCLEVPETLTLRCQRPEFADALSRVCWPTGSGCLEGVRDLSWMSGSRCFEGVRDLSRMTSSGCFEGVRDLS